ncbi:MAG: F0F1 ATP synthase subunit B [Elusimicrobia bacterium]|nr:F0F1 ATP synthase subunit B [Elusimicrobiota bacterium]
MEALIKPETGLIFWTVLIFAILVFLLSKTAWKPLLEAVNAREEKIKGDIEAAQKARDEAEAAKKEIENRLKGLSAEISSKLEKSSREAALERDKILEKASEQAALILDNAKKEIEAQKAQAEILLEKKVMEIALLAGEKALGAVIDKKINSQLAQELAKELSSGKMKKVGE